LIFGRSCIATSETDAFILIHVRRASSPRAASNTAYLAQRRDDAGADVGIIVRKHRGNASTRKNFPTAKLRCDDIKYPKACCGEGRAFNKHLILLGDK
jgi:hypothetical protein